MSSAVNSRTDNGDQLASMQPACSGMTDDECLSQNPVFKICCLGKKCFEGGVRFR